MNGMHDYEIDDSTTPDYMRTPPPTNIRGKEVCMLPQDWHDFGRAVAETWPQARYYAEPDYVNDPDARQCGPIPPPVRFFPTLGEACGYPYRARHRMVVFAPDWRPRFWKAESRREGGGWYWRLLPPPHPSVMIEPGGYIRDRPVPHPDTGSIHFYLTPKDKAHLALAARFFRLFGKFVTNRKGLVRVRLPEYEVTAPAAKGSPWWCGHHAVDWTRHDPKRVLFHMRSVFGTRATGEILPLAKPAAGAGPQERAAMSGMHDYEIDESITPGYMRTPPPTNIRGKEVCMLPQDWHDFGHAVAEIWPQARYYVEPDYVNDPDSWQCEPVPPPVRFFPTLGEACNYSGKAYHRIMVFDPDWRPRYRRTRSAWAPVDWYWLLLPSPHPSVHIRPGGYIRDRPVPHPDTGSIDFYLTPKDKAHLALAARFFRLFGKFATNRKGLVHVRVPELTVTVPMDKGQPSWCGHRAIEWARQEPDRVLFYARAGFGLRPTGEVLPLKKPAAGKGS